MQRKQGIIELGRRLVEHGPKKTLEAARRVRAIHNHTVIADTTKGVYVWEHDFYPAIYIPQKDLINSKLSDKEEIRVEGKGLASLAELITNGLRKTRPFTFTRKTHLNELTSSRRSDLSKSKSWERPLPRRHPPCTSSKRDCRLGTTSLSALLIKPSSERAISEPSVHTRAKPSTITWWLTVKR